MNAKLTIQRSLDPSNLWHWIVIFDNGHIWATSKESYESAGLALIDARENGYRALIEAESAK